MRAEDVFHHLSRFDTLDRFLFSGFIGVGDGGSEDIFDYAPREAFYEEFDGFGICKMITGDSCKAFEVVGVLVDFGPLQAKGFQLCPSALLALSILVLYRKLCEELFPNGWDIVYRLKGIDPLSHRPSPFG